MGIIGFLKGFGIKKTKDGVMLSWSTGSPFNPEYQIRTCPLKDIIKNKKEK